MKIELDITIDEAQGIIDYLKQNNDAKEGTDCLRRILDALYTKMCQQDRETESFREVIEGFLTYDSYPASPDPEKDPSLYDEEEHLG